MENVTHTSDMVAVVRCKDCQWHDKDFGMCMLMGILIDDEFYCKDGERDDCG